MVPIVVQSEHEIVGVHFATKKTAKKSLEQGVLWVVHPDTKKEIEYKPTVVVNKVIEKNGWFLAETVHATDDHSEEESKIQDTKATRADTSREDVMNQNTEKLYPKAYQDFPESLYAIITNLQSLIHSRRKTLPEGSYTTHLFESGGAQIRKKLGEEAIELVLAHGSDAIVSEGADFLYHLLVLLEYESVSFGKILLELQKRHMQ